MVEDTSFETRISELSKVIQDQSRFTRALVLICSAAVIGALFFTMTQMFALLPTSFVMEYMDKMPVIQSQWKILEQHSMKAAHPVAKVEKK